MLLAIASLIPTFADAHRLPEKKVEYLIIEFLGSDADIPKADFVATMTWRGGETEEYNALSQGGRKWLVKVAGRRVGIQDIDLYPAIEGYRITGPSMCSYEDRVSETLDESAAWYQFKVTSSVLHGLEVSPADAPVRLESRPGKPDRPNECCLAKIEWRQPFRKPEDQKLADAVSEALSQHQETGAFSIEVSARMGIVELRGSIGSARLKDRVIDLAGSVPGVRNVVPDGLTFAEQYAGTSRLSLNLPTLRLVLGGNGPQGLVLPLQLDESQRRVGGGWEYSRKDLEGVIDRKYNNRGSRGELAKDQFKQALGGLERIVVRRVAK